MRRTFRRVFYVFMALSLILAQGENGLALRAEAITTSTFKVQTASGGSDFESVLAGGTVTRDFTDIKVKYDDGSAINQQTIALEPGNNYVSETFARTSTPPIGVDYIDIIYAADSDGDGVSQATDNCPLVANPDQTDTDTDALGDACDPDDDNDGVLDVDDKCRLVSDSTNSNIDFDEFGDVCDPDIDNDGVLNWNALTGVGDNCDYTTNPDQKNTDSDSQGDACDTDDDQDGVLDATDNCPLVANPDQADADDDKVGDACQTANDDTTPPVITLIGSDPVSLIAGETYTDAGATATDDVDGVITANIVTVNPVNPAAAGTYTVTYDVKDAANNPAVRKTRTVTVYPEGTTKTKPIITLLGGNPVSVNVGDSYTDAGASASDNNDGVITDRIVTVNQVSTAAAGTYTVTYDVTNSFGVPADRIARTVNVNQKPSSGGGGFIISKFAPADAKIVINSGNDKAASRKVALSLTAAGATMMALSENADFSGSVWESFAPAREWMLTDGNGTKTVYAKFKNATGTESKTFSDTIMLEVKAGAGEEGEVKGVSTVNLKDGDIIRYENSADPFAVYVVRLVDGRKFIRHIPSEAFRAYKHLKWSDIIQVDSLEGLILSNWVRVNTGHEGTAAPGDRVWEINGDWTKHWLNMTALEFAARGGTEAAIFGVNQRELDAYVTGSDVWAE